ncbi:MAG TPA: hypothetical protein VJZ25_00635 [Gemmatimonadaceae bacterium]|nr:hypothetical protein [Gemmatimonadaceae bacterium]
MLKAVLAFCLAGSILPLCSSSVLAQSDKADVTETKSKWSEAIATASAPNPTRAEAEGTYDSRALRLEADWGRLRILQGVDGLVVGKAGAFKTANVEKIVAGSPRAETEAKLFRASHRRGALAASVGTVTLVVGIAVASSNANNAATPVLMIAGAGGMLWGARQINAAYSSLSRAVWWYNRDLPR